MSQDNKHNYQDIKNTTYMCGTHSAEIINNNLMNKLSLTRMLFVIAVSMTLTLSTYAQDGEATFKQICSACHTIGKGKLVGPDLANVTKRRTNEWLLKFIKSSQTLIKSGDKTADSVFQAYGSIVMPDQPDLDDSKINAVLTFIDTKSSGITAAPTADTNTTTAPTSTTPSGKTALFTPITITLLLAMCIMLGIIIVQDKVNKRLTEQIRDFYSSDKSFFRKK